ncbi:leucine-rich repeat domain-containing protein, partial [Acholeplasma laidlawii]|uniref:leucine-rich repeat domain-containing protein n=1 Tax=Acholeplasma laidlawii TaxID=2148 RepID=UPI0018C23FA8
SGSTNGYTANISANVTKIPNYMFDNTNLTNVNIEEGSQLENIGSRAFYGTKITSFTLPNSVTSIGSSAFSSTRQLLSFIFEEDSKLESISSSMFQDSAITSITIPASVISIGSSAFAAENYSATYTSGLTSVTFEEGSQLTSIGANAFQKARLLESIIIP